MPQLRSSRVQQALAWFLEELRASVRAPSGWSVGKLFVTPTHSVRPRERSTSLQVEALEDRSVPSVSQWASSVLGFSSQYSPGAWSAAAALGAPNVGGYGDNPNAWAPAPINGTLETLSLGFDTPVYATGLTVRESWGNGFVTRVDLLDGAGTSHTIWTGTDPSQRGVPTDFTINFATTSYQVRGVKVFVDTNHDGSAWEEIDAVQLRGELTPPDAPPTPVNDTFAGAEDSDITGDVLVNDSDPDGDALSASVVNGPTHGSLTLEANGTFRYTPDPNYNGPDSFTYAATDPAGQSATATVDLTVASVNDPPIAADDVASTDEDQAVIVNVRANDSSGPDAGEALTVQATTPPGHGTVTLNTDGTVTYTPNANFNGSDQFTYTLSDGNGGTATGTVTVTVNAVNDAPTAGGAAFQTRVGKAVIGTLAGLVSDGDGDPLRFAVAAGPSHGSLSLGVDGKFVYTPVAGYVGADAFTYQASDGQGGSATAVVTLNVAATREVHLVAGRGLVFHGYDRLFGALPGPHKHGRLKVVAVNGSAASVGQAIILDSGGRLRVTKNGLFIYKPPHGFTGEERFTCSFIDGSIVSFVVSVPKPHHWRW